MKKKCRCRHGSGSITTKLIEENNLCACKCHSRQINVYFAYLSGLLICIVGLNGLRDNHSFSSFCLLMILLILYFFYAIVVLEVD